MPMYSTLFHVAVLKGLFGARIPKTIINFSLQVVTGNDPLDSKDFNPVDYINTLFPTEQVNEIMRTS